MTQLTTFFENLEPGTTYHIGFILAIDGASISSDWQVAETMCNRELIFIQFTQLHYLQCVN